MIRVELKIGSARDHVAVAVRSLAQKYDFDLDVVCMKTDVEAEAVIYKNNKKQMIVFGHKIKSEIESILERNWN